ncbi:MAG: N-acetylmuramoyl-L-alanine amidase [Clostridiales bacterium]|nr:N-acetylmuramoyl-L-alanine amidase [Clostridiales bacterium]
MKMKLFCIGALLLLSVLLLGCGGGENPAVMQPHETEGIVLDTIPSPKITELSPVPCPLSTETPEPTATPEPLPLEGIIIGVDPGHQGTMDGQKEPNAPWDNTGKARVAGGCRGVNSRIMEYEVVLQIGLRLRDLLEEQGATVILTRDTNDINISNKERAELFNAHEVDLGIRLHLNNGSGRGAFMLVPKKNCTDWYDTNVAAAKTIIAVFCADTGLPMVRPNEYGLTYRSDQTGFNWSTRPIVCIEMGHLSHRDDDALFSDPAFWDIAARALCRGLTEYFQSNKE